MYDSVRSQVSCILTVSTNFVLESSTVDRKEKVRLIPLKTLYCKSGLYFDNPMIATLAEYASYLPGLDNKPLPEIILGLCVNNWGMYNGRNALIEAILGILGPEYRTSVCM
jgi:hypothetical protein